jgi:hypothetical protein
VTTHAVTLLLITVVEKITREASAQSMAAETDRHFNAESKMLREKKFSNRRGVYLLKYRNAGDH